MPQFEKDRKLYFESFPGWKTFQTFPDQKDLKSKINLTRQVSIDGDVYPHGDFDFSKKVIDVKIMIGLEKLNELGAGVYLCINTTDGKGRKAGNITKVRSVFADFDDPAVPLPDLRLEPSMIVESSPGKYHVYFFTGDTPLAGFTDLQKAIAYNLGSDKTIHDLPRILRVPGFNHRKGDPFMTKIVKYTGLKYSYGLLVETFPPQPVEQWSAPKYQKTNYDTKEFKGNLGAGKGSRNVHIMKRIGGAKKRGLSWPEIEAEAYKEGAACAPPVKVSEIRAILKSFRRYF